MKNELGFTSRYAIKKALGVYPPWQGFDVTDSLSGKDYLLFSLVIPSETSISTDDLLMRDYLFSDAADDSIRALSIQQSGGSVFFLLPWQELVPVKKMLPSLRAEESLELLRSLISTFFDCISTGRFFHNLSIESIVVRGNSAGILPTAYLVPEAVLDRLDVPGGAGISENFFNDLNAFGELLSIFCRYLPEAHSNACAETAGELRDIGPGNGDDLFPVIEKLSRLSGRDSGSPVLLAGRKPLLKNHSAAMKLVRQAAFKSREDGKQMVIVSGRAGTGKTSVLEEISGKLTAEWGYEGGGIAGDQSEQEAKQQLADYVTCKIRVSLGLMKMETLMAIFPAIAKKTRQDRSR